MKTLMGYYTATSDLDADLQTFAGITPSANVQSLLGAADYAAMKTLLAIAQSDITDLVHTDTAAWHISTSNELSGTSEKASPVSGDWVLIEDSESSGAKKKAQLGNLPAGTGTDAAAIHDNVSGEIHAVTEKASPVNTDELIVEDSAASYGKKRVQIGNLPGSTDDQTATEVATSTGSFNGILSGSNTTVQSALDTIDDHNHSGVYESATSDNIDPDRLNGDTVDDNLIDNALLDTDLQTFAGITPSANTLP